jgi:Tfp pilus assembly protein PilO
MRSGATNRLIVAVVAIAVLAGAFWMLALSPKRKEASELSVQVSQTREALFQHQGEAAQAEEAERQFPRNYEQLVVLGKAVPGDDDAASLLVQLNQIAAVSHVRFQTLSLGGSGETEPAPETPAPAEAGGGAPVSPTEVAASTLPLGAAIGPAGLAVMPYELTFKGDFFHIADFIQGLDALVKSENEKVDVRGRLITVNGFSLAASQAGFPDLEASFTVTTYLTPPSEGVTAGATPESPVPAASTPAATTTGGTP